MKSSIGTLHDSTWHYNKNTFLPMQGCPVKHAVKIITMY